MQPSTYSSFSGTSMATPMAVSFRPLNDGKSPQQRAADQVAQAAKRTGQSVEQTLYNYFNPVDDHMFQVGMSEQEIASQEQAKRARMGQVADILDVELSLDKELHFQQEQERQLQAMIRSLGGRR